MKRSRYAAFIIFITLLFGCLMAAPITSNAQAADLLYREGMGKVLIINGFHYGLPLPDATTSSRAGRRICSG